MISYNSTYFEVAINMSQVSIELSPPTREWGDGRLLNWSMNFTNKNETNTALFGREKILFTFRWAEIC